MGSRIYKRKTFHKLKFKVLPLQFAHEPRHLSSRYWSSALGQQHPPLCGKFKKTFSVSKKTKPLQQVRLFEPEIALILLFSAVAVGFNFLCIALIFLCFFKSVPFKVKEKGSLCYFFFLERNKLLCILTYKITKEHKTTSKSIL